MRAARLAAASRGGKGAPPVSVGALAEDSAVAALDLQTAGGLRAFLAATLGALGRLPFSERTAQAVSAIATCQRNAIETGVLTTRIDALEAAHSPGPKLKRA